MTEKAPSPSHFFKPGHSGEQGLAGIILVVVALAVCGLLLVWRYAALDLGRDMRTWQDKLNLLADSRASAVSEWVDGHYIGLKKLADNPSLQLYFAELSVQGRTPPQEVEPAQKTYLRNLLSFTADRLGFAPQGVPLSTQIPAQIQYEASAGIAVLDNNENIVVSTPYLTSLEPNVLNRLRALPGNTPAMIDMYRGEQGKTQIGFVMPVYGIQADPGSSGPIGRIVGIRVLDDAVSRLLHHPGVTEKTLEAVLVRKDGDNIVYLSSLADGAAPLEKQLRADDAQLAEAQAVNNPGEFIYERGDYRSRPVLATARQVAGTPWFVVMKIDRSEALAQTQVRRTGMMIVLFLVLAAVVATVVAVWHSASSRRALFTSRYFQEMAARSRAQEKLLKLVSDSQPEAVYILDSAYHYQFANINAARDAAMNGEDVVGKTVNDVLGSARAHEIVEACEVAMKERRSVSRIRHEQQELYEKVIRAEYVPLASIPVPDLPDNMPGVLVVEQDISEVVQERERRIQSHRQLIDTLVSIVDKRDPNAAHHSHRVAQIAYAVADAMELEEVQCETACLAGSLMNIGKVVVPANVLTKRETLADDELKTIRDSITTSAELLRDVTFDGPVVDTLRQVHEHWDGSGPMGLKGEDILITARIIAVVNAFVAMISPRSYRSALSLDTAFKDLMQHAGMEFDRRVVAALIDYMENHGGKALLKQLLGEQRGAA